MLTYVNGDATRPQGEGPKFIIHCCNDIGAWGAGFVMAVSRRWGSPKEGCYSPEDAYYSLKPFSDELLGVSQIVKVDEELWIIKLEVEVDRYIFALLLKGFEHTHQIKNTLYRCRIHIFQLEIDGGLVIGFLYIGLHPINNGFKEFPWI